MLSERRLQQIADKHEHELSPVVAVCDICDAPIRVGDEYTVIEVCSLTLCERCRDKHVIRRWAE